jgi:outer membrane protein assembly factor BamA
MFMLMQRASVIILNRRKMKKFILSAVLLTSMYIKAQQDTMRLPFAIAGEKRLSDDDVRDKKEGAYVTGVPDFSSDPVNGLGYGLEGELYFNGKRSDPFFAYTPYRYKLSVVAFNTTKSQREFSLNFDAPYIFHTKWRLRATTVYESNPNRLYFGFGSETLNPLTTPTNPSHPYGNYEDYLKALQHVRPGKAGEAPTVTDFFYNNFTQEESVSNVTMEHSFLDGRMRVMIGYELGIVKVTTFDNYTYHHAIDSAGNTGISVPNGETRLAADSKAGLVRGVGTNVLGMTQAGIIYDTRDLEADPGKGIFAEITNEWSSKYLGSIFNFSKWFFHVKGYFNLFPAKYKAVVVAARTGLEINQGGLPFYENYDCYSSEGSIEGLGGPRTLRGYKQWRFSGRYVNFNNLEVRVRVFQANILKQHLAFGLVPFMDAGAVWDKANDIGNWNNLKYDGGMGLRIAWNVNTILRFDYAVSKEDRQFFFQFGHAF